MPEEAKYVKQILYYLKRKKLIDTLGHRKQYQYFITSQGIDEVKNNSDIEELICILEHQKCHN